MDDSIYYYYIYNTFQDQATVLLQFCKFGVIYFFILYNLCVCVCAYIHTRYKILV